MINGGLTISNSSSWLIIILPDNYIVILLCHGDAISRNINDLNLYTTITTTATKEIAASVTELKRFLSMSKSIATSCTHCL